MRLLEIAGGIVTVEVGSVECQRLAEGLALAEGATTGNLPAALARREDLEALFGALALFWEAAGLAAEASRVSLSDFRRDAAGAEASELRRAADSLAPPTEKPWPPRTTPGRKTDQRSGELPMPDESERDPGEVVQGLFSLVGRQAGQGIIAAALRNAMDATGESLDSPTGTLWQELVTDVATRHAEEQDTLRRLHERAMDMFGEDAAWQLFAGVLVDGVEEGGESYGSR